MKSFHNKKYFFQNTSTESGIGLIEILVGVSILVVILVGLISVLNTFFKVGVSNTEKIQATFLLEETTEVLRSLRGDGWDSIALLTVDTPYYLTFSGTAWGTSMTQVLIDDVFDRSFMVHDVYRRDSDSDIIASTSPDTKTIDPNTIYITTSVKWSNGTEELKSETYMTNSF